MPITQEELREHKAKLLLQDPTAMAKQRMMEFADDIDEDYEDLLSAATDYQENGEYWYGTANKHGYFDKLEGVGIYPEFWDDYDIIMEKVTAPEDRGHFFTCSC